MLLLRMLPCRLCVSPSRVPPLIAQFWAPLPVRVQVELPVFWNSSKRWNFPDGPISPTSKTPCPFEGVSSELQPVRSGSGEDVASDDRGRTKRQGIVRGAELDRGSAC